MTTDPAISSNPSAPSLVGGCQCGQVRFRLDRPPIVTHCCHCRSCQKVSGSAFAVNLMIETAAVTVVAGEPRAFHGVDSHEVRRCEACGFTLWSFHPQLGRELAIVRVGVLDDGDRLAPEAHYFTRSKHPWVALPPGVPSFDGFGHPDRPDAHARIIAAMAKGGMTAPS